MTDSLTAERLRELLHYDPVTGEFWWKVRRRNHPAGVRAGCEHYRGRSVHRVIVIEGRQYYEHRLVWLYMFGKWPAGIIDHRNCNGADNKFANLREATTSQNTANSRAVAHKKFKGVYPSGNRTYRARMQINGRMIHLGSFATPEEASAVYLRKAIEIHGEFARAA